MAHHEPVTRIGLGWWEPVPKSGPAKGPYLQRVTCEPGSVEFFSSCSSDALAGFELVCLEACAWSALGGCSGKQGTKAQATLSVDPPHLQGCWNCGRKASETCSGCKRGPLLRLLLPAQGLGEAPPCVCGQSLQGPAATVKRARARTVRHRHRPWAPACPRPLPAPARRAPLGLPPWLPWPTPGPLDAAPLTHQGPVAIETAQPPARRTRTPPWEPTMGSPLLLLLSKRKQNQQDCIPYDFLSYLTITPRPPNPQKPPAEL